MRIPITIYPTHIRLCKKDIQKLFGKKYNLTPHKILPQENIFFCKENLNLIHHNKSVQNIPIIGPAIKETQVILMPEIDKKLHTQALLSFPGRRELTHNISIQNKNVTIYFQKAAFIPKVHLQISTPDAKYLGLKHNKTIALQINRTQIILNDITVKIKDSYSLDLYLPEYIAKKFHIKKTDRATII